MGLLCLLCEKNVRLIPRSRGTIGPNLLRLFEACLDNSYVYYLFMSKPVSPMSSLLSAHLCRNRSIFCACRAGANIVVVAV